MAGKLDKAIVKFTDNFGIDSSDQFSIISVAGSLCSRQDFISVVIERVEEVRNKDVGY